MSVGVDRAEPRGAVTVRVLPRKDAARPAEVRAGLRHPGVEAPRRDPSVAGVLGDERLAGDDDGEGHARGADFLDGRLGSPALRGRGIEEEALIIRVAIGVLVVELDEEPVLRRAYGALN